MPQTESTTKPTTAVAAPLTTDLLQGRLACDVRSLDWVAHDRTGSTAQLGLCLAQPLQGQHALSLALSAAQVHQLLPMLLQLLASMHAPEQAQQAGGQLPPMRVDGWQVLSTPDASQFVLHLQVGPDLGLRFALEQSQVQALAKAVLAVPVPGVLAPDA